MEVLHKLGIDWKLLLAQGVNFLILLYILKRYAYAPMLRFLDEREARITKGLEDAKQAAEKLTATEKEQSRVLEEAQKEAKTIIEEAVTAAKRRDGEALEKTKADIAKMMEDHEARMEAEREKMIREAKQELSSLVVSATEKVLQEKLDAGKDKSLIEKSLGV